MCSQTDLGDLSTGGEQLVGPVVSGSMRSELGFVPQFSGSVKYAADYLTSDPGDDGVSRPSLSGTVFPDNGDTPFLFRATGVQMASPELGAIVATNTTSGLAIPYGSVYSGTTH